MGFLEDAIEFSQKIQDSCTRIIEQITDKIEDLQKQKKKLDNAPEHTKEYLDRQGKIIQKKIDGLNKKAEDIKKDYTKKSEELLNKVKDNNTKLLEEISKAKMSAFNI